MYKYEFVRIEMKSGFMKSKPSKNYHDIIESYAKNGWKFKQVFAPAMSGYGSASYFELIFEKKM